MPLLANRTYRSNDVQVSLSDKADPYNLQNYHIRDDSEITSSDENEIDDLSDEMAERTCFLSERPQSADITDPHSTETKKVHKSESPFKRGISSFFRRSDHRAASQSEQSATHDRSELEAPDFQEDSDTSETNGGRPSSSTSSSKFWRSWRSRQHRRNAGRFKENHLEDAPSGVHGCDANIGTVFAKQTGDFEESEVFGETTGETIEDLEALLNTKNASSVANTLAKFDGVKELFRKNNEGDNSESEASDEGLDELGLSRYSNMDGVSSNLSQAPSPLTPVDEVSAFTKTSSKKMNMQYKDVYRTTEDYVTVEEQFDHLQVNKNSKTYFNLLSTIRLLNKPSRSSSDLSTLEDYTRAVLVLAELSADEAQRGNSATPTTTDVKSENCPEKTVESADQIIELESELSLLREKYEDSISDLYNCRKDLKLTKAELVDARNEISESTKEMNTFKAELDARNEEVVEIDRTMKLKLAEEKKLREAEESKLQNLRKDHEKLQFEHAQVQNSYQDLAQQEAASRDKIHELIGIISENDLKARELQQSHDRLEKSFCDSNRLAKKATSANKKLGSDCRREHLKLEECRRELELAQGQLELLNCHKTESLQFMAQIMMSFKNALCEETLQQCDAYLESISSNQLFTCALLQGANGVYKDQWKQQAIRERDQVADFYRHFAKTNLLDQIFAKYVSYMRSNRFLSQQLRGLRQKEHDHEEYIARLLQDCKSQRTLIAKQDHRIDSLKKDSKPQAKVEARTQGVGR
ncbi:LAFA_0F03026g1_1 [Lachancea sp. 'fantastica']|nr:LAFA_0F03026g1_1 [Lachancea sp. 'fantastica']